MDREFQGRDIWSMLFQSNISWEHGCIHQWNVKILHAYSHCYFVSQNIEHLKTYKLETRLQITQFTLFWFKFFTLLNNVSISQKIILHACYYVNKNLHKLPMSTSKNFKPHLRPMINWYTSDFKTTPLYLAQNAPKTYYQ